MEEKALLKAQNFVKKVGKYSAILFGFGGNFEIFISEKDDPDCHFKVCTSIGATASMMMMMMMMITMIMMIVIFELAPPPMQLQAEPQDVVSHIASPGRTRKLQM